MVVEVETPAGRYALEADWFIDATGANSRIREAMGLEVNPSRSTDRWCITDVRFKVPFPTERWTWVDAPFNEGRAVWQHLMADDVWRLDYQMAEDCDPETISRPEVAGARLRAQLGPEVDFEFVWIGPYQYRDHLLETFRVGRTLFIGDSAHVVSPFGARGGNNGIQDAANLGWKLALVLAGEAGDELLDSYHAERHPAAVENLTVCRRTARFWPRAAAPSTHPPRRLYPGQAARVRPPPRQHRPDGAGQRLSASPWAKAGARSVQNVAFEGTTLMRCLASGTRFLGLAFGADASTLARLDELAALFPIDFHRVDPAGRSPPTSARPPARWRSCGPMPTSRRGSRPSPRRSPRRCATPSAATSGPGSPPERKDSRPCAPIRTWPTPTASTKPGWPRTKA